MPIRINLSRGLSIPQTSLAQGCARLVKAVVGLEAACIDLGNRDTHFFQGTTGGIQTGLIDSLSRGLAAFDADLKHHRDRVATIAMTEFGRRLYENGSADNAWESRWQGNSNDESNSKFEERMTKQKMPRPPFRISSFDHSDFIRH